MADWSDTAEAYAASFAALCAGAVEALLDAVALRVPPPATLLDVGTGPGTVLGAARDRGWRAAGADAEVSMVAAARRRHPDAVVDHAALPELPYPDDAFDAVTANFVVNHVPDPRAGVAELARVAHRVVAVTAWAGQSSPLRPLWDAVLTGAGIARPPEATLPPELDFTRTEDGLTGVLADAGLVDIAVETVSWEFATTPDALWHGVEGGVATVGGIYLAADAEGRAQLAAAYRAETARRVDGTKRLVVPHSALLGLGRPAR